MYINSIRRLGALQLLGVSLEYDIWHMVAWILDISTNIHQVHHTYWWEFRHIHIMRTQSCQRFTLLQYGVIVPWCLPIFTAFIPCTHCTPYVNISHMGFHVYETYTHSVYNMYTSDFTFPTLVIRPLDIYAFSNITFPIVPVACGCLLVGSTPPWGPGPQ